jgi:hypothetical protein
MLTEDSEKWPFRAILMGVFFGRKPRLGVLAYRQGGEHLMHGIHQPGRGK